MYREKRNMIMNSRNAIHSSNNNHNYHNRNNFIHAYNSRFNNNNYNRNRDWQLDESISVAYELNRHVVPSLDSHDEKVVRPPPPPFKLKPITNLPENFEFYRKPADSIRNHTIQQIPAVGVNQDGVYQREIRKKSPEIRKQTSWAAFFPDEDEERGLKKLTFSCINTVRLPPDPLFTYQNQKTARSRWVEINTLGSRPRTNEENKPGNVSGEASVPGNTNAGAAAQKQPVVENVINTARDAQNQKLVSK
jgi:hypothetical protein